MIRRAFSESILAPSVPASICPNRYHLRISFSAPIRSCLVPNPSCPSLYRTFFALWTNPHPPSIIRPQPVRFEMVVVNECIDESRRAGNAENHCLPSRGVMRHSLNTTATAAATPGLCGPLLPISTDGGGNTSIPRALWTNSMTSKPIQWKRNPSSISRLINRFAGSSPGVWRTGCPIPMILSPCHHSNRKRSRLWLTAS